MSDSEIYCTMVLTPAYLQGAEVVVHQLRLLDPDHKIVCLATPQTLNAQVLARLTELFDSVELVEPVVAGPSPELTLLSRPDLHSATTKFHLWNLKYDKVVYLDADTLPLQSLSPLFEVPLRLDGRSVAASPDAGWPDTFNSGVLVLKPNPDVFHELQAHLREHGSFDGADQGVLNELLTWERLPFVYNVTVNTAYEYAPAYERFKNDIKLLHFIGPAKPWDAGEAGGSREATVAQWWGVYKSATVKNSAILKALNDAETANNYGYDQSKIIAPSPDHWDARTHQPFKSTKPEFPSESPDVDKTLNDLHLESVHIFPELGPSLVKLPFESDQTPAERDF